jgi:PAS domain S-box-containing protein
MSVAEPRFELLRQTVDALPVAVALQVGGRTLFVNSRFVELFGYSQAQIADLEAWWLSAYPDPTYREGLRNEWRRRIARAAASGRAAEPMDTHVTCIDGSIRNVEIHLTPAGEAFVVTFIDVSRRKRNEATLRDYQARLDLTLATAKAAYWELNLASGTHKLSPNYYALLGYAATAAPRDRAGWLALLHPDDVAEFERRQQAAVPTATEGWSEFRIRASDGSWRWLLSHFRAVDFDRGGTPGRLIGIDLDITSRKQAELALQAARDRAQQYLDIAGVILVALDCHGAITLLNRRGCEVLQVGEAEILGRDWYDIFAPLEEREEQRAIYHAFICGARGEQDDIELTAVVGCGEQRLIKWRSVLLHDEAGRVIGSLSSGEDVTAQRAAERKRDEARALIAATAEASPDGLLVTDSEGRYLFWNNRLREMWGLAEDYLRLRQIESRVTQELLAPYLSKVVEPESFLAQTEGIYGSGARAPISGDLVLNDGRVFASYTARVASGTLSAVAWICRDVTEEKRRDAELAQSQRLNAIGELSGGVAHDFNNLLTIIGGNLELIQGCVAGSQPAGSFAETALAAVQRGAELTQRLLAFSRQQPLAPSLTDVNGLIGEVLEMLPRMLGEAITLEFLPAAELWPTVVDPGQLQTALINLATNARDAMPNGGSMRVATANCVVDDGYAGSVAELLPGAYVEIRVTDEGPGMPSEIAKRAFEPFFTTKPVGQGTGLGLSMVFGFVKQSGGHVAIDSEEKHGTTIRILLPRAPVEAKPALANPPPGRRRRPGMTVLLVEDEPAVSGVARAFLEDLDCRVVEARSGPEALALLHGGTAADLLFTDVILPGGMTGPEVAAAAVALRPELRVLYASGYAEEALTRVGQLDRAVVLLQKPYRKQELVQALDRVMPSS